MNGTKMNETLDEMLGRARRVHAAQAAGHAEGEVRPGFVDRLLWARQGAAAAPTGWAELLPWAQWGAVAALAVAGGLTLVPEKPEAVQLVEVARPWLEMRGTLSLWGGR